MLHEEPDGTSLLNSFLRMFPSFWKTCVLFCFLYVVVQMRPCHPIANHPSHPLGVTVHLEPHPPKDRQVLVKERGHEVSTSVPTLSTATPATSGPTARDSIPESYVSHSSSPYTVRNIYFDIRALSRSNTLSFL